jgi:hypothetical protein
MARRLTSIPVPGPTRLGRENKVLHEEKNKALELASNALGAATRLQEVNEALRAENRALREDKKELQAEVKLLQQKRQKTRARLEQCHWVVQAARADPSNIHTVKQYIESMYPTAEQRVRDALAARRQVGVVPQAPSILQAPPISQVPYSAQVPNIPQVPSSAAGSKLPGSFARRQMPRPLSQSDLMVSLGLASPPRQGNSNSSTNNNTVWQIPKVPRRQ